MEPQINTDERGLNVFSEKIIGCSYSVSNELGIGFLEKVYENAMYVALIEAGLRVAQQQPITVRFRGVVVGEYIADLLVEDQILVELKAVKALDEIHVAQCLNYLKATGLHLCLLINFGRSKVEIKRLVRDL